MYTGSLETVGSIEASGPSTTICTDVFSPCSLTTVFSIFCLPIFLTLFISIQVEVLHLNMSSLWLFKFMGISRYDATVFIDEIHLSRNRADDPSALFRLCLHFQIANTRMLQVFEKLENSTTFSHHLQLIS